MHSRRDFPDDFRPEKMAQMQSGTLGRSREGDPMHAIAYQAAIEAVSEPKPAESRRAARSHPLSG
jgi:hypothetical protein